LGTLDCILPPTELIQDDSFIMPRAVDKVIHTPLCYMSEGVYPKWHVFSFISLDLKNKTATLSKLEVYNTKHLPNYFKSLRMYIKSFGIKTLKVLMNPLEKTFFPASLSWNTGILMCSTQDVSMYFKELTSEEYYIFEFDDQKEIKPMLDYYSQEVNHYLIPNLNQLIKEYGDNIPYHRVKNHNIKEWKLTPLINHQSTFNYMNASINQIHKLQLVTKQNLSSAKMISKFSTSTYEV
jgi:hypothetical protein